MANKYHYYFNFDHLFFSSFNII